MSHGQIGSWLGIGPFPAEGDGDLETDYLHGEATVEPATGDNVGELTWVMMENEPKPVRGLLGRTKNKVCYLHSYLYSEKGGQAVLQVAHPGGLKVYLNGEGIYKGEKSAGLWANIRNAMKRLDHRIHYRREGISQCIGIRCKPGWNRLLVKSFYGNGDRHNSVRLQFADREDIQYRTENIRWVTRLPDWGVNSPIVVNDRIFLCCEPDLLVCLDKKTGEVVWSRSTPIYAAVTHAERERSPELKRIDPLARELEDPKTDQAKRVKLRQQIQAILHAVDQNHYAFPTSKCAPSTGLTFPTPVSDGKHVYVFPRTTIAACYDMAGNRKWIRNLIKELTLAPSSKGHANVGFNVSAPLLAGNKLILMRNYLAALDAQTGELVWKAPELHGHTVDKYHDRVEMKTRYNANFSATPALITIGGEEVIICGKASVVRVRDGKLLLTGDKKVTKVRAGWVWDGKDDVWWTGHGGGARVVNFGGKPEARTAISAIRPPGMRKGKWALYTCFAPPLYYDGLVYINSTYGMFSVTDAKTRTLLAERKLDFGPHPMVHGNGGWSHGCCNAPTLGGKHIFVMDNQLNTIVVEPGRALKEVAKNGIDNFLPRLYPERWQDSPLTNPVFDEDCIYIRGEKDLFCIGETE